MYDIKWIRENPETFDTGLKRRGLEPLSAKLMALDETRRALITTLEQAQARRNAASKEIGQAKAKKDEATAQKLMAEVAEFKTSIPDMEAKEREASAALERELAQIPNLPLADVPDGKDEHDNVERRKFGKKRDFIILRKGRSITVSGKYYIGREVVEGALKISEAARKFGVSTDTIKKSAQLFSTQTLDFAANETFTPKQHFELGEALGMMDFELAAKLSGSRFVVLQKGLARLERALGQFMLDLHTGEEHGYTEVNPPILVRDEVMFGTAQLPKFREDQFLALNLAVADKDAKDLVELVRGELGQGSTDREGWIKRINRLSETMEALNYDRAVIRATVEKAIEKYDLADLFAEEKRPSIGRLWLIPTAEVPLTNLVRESIVAEDQLPMRLTACTPCFRAEAGAAGKDTRGMIRQHQFTKVELVSITTPEQSRDEHERMLACAEAVLKKLDLHYRVITLCTGDMGFASQKTYDIEVWLPGQNMYREISSCSVCGDFQARRMNARYRGADGKVKGPVHTLNGSGVAVGRALIAVMETYQQENGSIAVPEALKPYMGGLTTIERT